MMLWLAAGNVTLLERVALVSEAWVDVPMESPFPWVKVPP